MEERDSQILDHIGRYTISVRAVIEDLFFAGGNSGNTLDRLAEQQLIQRVRNALNGNYSYYQLTAKGAKSRGLPPNKATGKRETGLAQNLAALWFSCRGGFRRKRLNDEELNTLCGTHRGGNVIHVAQDDSEDETTVFRLFIPSEDTATKKNYVTALKATAYDALNNERLSPWIERGTYRFAVLVHSQVRKDDLERLLHTSNFPRIRVLTEIAPTPSTFPLFISADEEAS